MLNHASTPPGSSADSEPASVSSRMAERNSGLYRKRQIKDKVVHHMVSLGGASVLIAILLIFFYLLYVVYPLFEPASIVANRPVSLPGSGNTLYIGQEEQGEMAVRVTDESKIIFFKTSDGKQVEVFDLALPAKITAVGVDNETLALGLQDGGIKVVRYGFDTGYSNNQRTLTPRLEYPLGEDVLYSQEGEPGKPVAKVALHIASDSAGLVKVDEIGDLEFSRYSREESFLDESINTELESTSHFSLSSPVKSVLLAPLLDHLYIAQSGGRLLDFELGEDGFGEVPAVFQTGDEINDMKFLPGGFALLIGMNNGEIQQWMPVRKKNIEALTYIRKFDENTSAVNSISVEHHRKSFAVADAAGVVTLYYSTSRRVLAKTTIPGAEIRHLAWSDRAENLLVSNDKEQAYQMVIDNHYPEISWNVLWGKVWYEGYDKPDYIWQSSASNNDFEPKFSLVPLSFGTIKAAVYAMLFAIPIAILGAIFTAQFMAPQMRQVVKPSIEIMEALPTVILGFLAGLWLAPYVEKHLVGILILLIVLPASFVATAFAWRFVPGKQRFEGWEALILLPVILIITWLAMQISLPLEELLFDGNVRVFMKEHWGIGYDQRNALVVGLIMGFAVIPTIFSIAEDALFTVPQHLVNGSLALGATRWQTLMKVVLPAASPGIFSGLMMGFGRAVGETMIVLMATGNTPVMDMSIFEGMRTLSANLAVEVPEAEVASTHYRVLFLAALVLFVFTFVFNTGAEIIRQRMRKRYSAL